MILLTWFILSTAFAEAPKTNDKCLLALAELDAFLGAQSRDCKTNGDCQGYYFNPKPCAKAVVLTAKIVTEEFESKLKPYQDHAHAACDARWANRAACSPPPYSPFCDHGECRDHAGK